MKPSIVVKMSFAVCAFASSLAQAEPFKEAMGLMGKSMKAIVADLNAGKMNQEAVESLHLGCKNALNNVPSDYKQDQDFVGPIIKVCTAAEELSRASNLAEAQKIVKQMLQLKETSHDKYKL